MKRYLVIQKWVYRIVMPILTAFLGLRMENFWIGLAFGILWFPIIESLSREIVEIVSFYVKGGDTK